VVGACEITGLAVVLHLDADSLPQAYEWHPCMTGLSIFFPFETRQSMSVVCPEGNTMNFAAVVVGPRGEIGIYGIDFLGIDGSPPSTVPHLLMSAVCPLGNRITYVSSSECQVNGEVLLVTGTSTGGITVWGVGGGSGPYSGEDCNGRLHALQTFPHAHEATPVRFLSKPVLKEGPVFAFNFESAGSNGTLQKFAFYYNTANPSKLVRRGENKCDDLLIIVGFSTANVLHANQEYFAAETCFEYCWGFKGTKFGVWRDEEEIEVCSITCGSWRRPWTVSHTLNRNPDYYRNHNSGATLTFCFDSGGRHVTVYRRILYSASDSGQLIRPNCALPTSLSFSPFHGREINALAIVTNGVSLSKDDVMVVTGGEDSTVRGTFVRIPAVRPQLYRSILIGEHAGGTAVKNLALKAMYNKSGVSRDDQKYLLVTAGAKRVLMAWTITTRPAKAEWISSHVQEQVLRRKSWSGGRASGNASGHASGNAPNNAADIRYVAVDVYYRSSTEEAFVIAATSTGEMEVLRLGASTADRQITFCQSWISILRLVHHTTPVLSLQCLELEDDGDGDDRGMIIVISGGTDGSLVVWRIAQSDLTWELGANVERVDMHPLAVIPSIHQSGVNDLTIVKAMVKASLSDPEFDSKAYKNAVLVVSAGDDQSIAVTMLDVNMHPTPNGQTRPAVNVLGSAVQKNAHASAVRGIWADDKGTVFSIGLDQRIRRWRVSLSNDSLEWAGQGIRTPDSSAIAIEEIGSAFTQVLEPSSIGVEVREGTTYGMRCYVIAVAGRGMEIIRWLL